MSDILTIAEMAAQFVSEWVLVEDPQTNDALEVKGGKVRWHSKYRDEVYRKRLSFAPSGSPCSTLTGYLRHCRRVSGFDSAYL